jgi:hypothetical protein
MGVDAADFNNDLRPDVFVADMLPDREEILKTSANTEDFRILDLKTRAGYHPQYSRNTLQLNRGGGRFSEIGYLAGVHATDWSWAPLFADFDNDGRKDLFVSNGIYRRPNDLDYIRYVGADAVQRALLKGIDASNLSLIERMPRTPLANYLFRNEGGLRFRDRAAAWGLSERGFSNGAVYVDLNNSGALDLVVNNVNAPATIYRNRAREANGNHFLRVRLEGTRGNRDGIGAKVSVRAGASAQMLEQMPTRGFQSAVDTRLHFGLGEATRVDTLTVIWPDQRFEVLAGIGADREITLRQADAEGRHTVVSSGGAPLFTDDTLAVSGAPFTHRENSFLDFDYEPLLTHLMSTEGPALAVGDVNGDSLDDLFVGGGKWQADALYVQQSDGRFARAGESAFRADSLHESVDAVFLDVDGDGDQDLYVVSGGNEFFRSDEALRNRLYVNDGRGDFARDREAIPSFFENASVVAPADFNGDGFTDVFVGSRVVPRKYGLTPRSHLLQNDGNGRFLDVTLTESPALAQAGMVTAAAWLDYNNDGKLDLIVVGEWMPVRVFARENRRFVDRTKEAGLAGSNGWWNSITVADVNDDGRRDLILGNLGLNSYIKASHDEPARLFVRDFGDNGTLEQILTTYRHGVSYPVAGRDELIAAIPSLRRKYATYASFGASRIEDIVPASELRDATVLEARTLSSSVAINNGDGTFELRPLPDEAQLAPVFAAAAEDFDSDGRTDIVVAGNFHGVTPVRGRYDASHGLLLRGRIDGGFDPVDMEASGLVIEGQVRDLKTLRRAGGGRLIVVARNNGRLQVLRPLHTSSHERGSR